VAFSPSSAASADESACTARIFPVKSLSFLIPELLLVITTWELSTYGVDHVY